MNTKKETVGKEITIKEIITTGTPDLMCIQRGPGPVLILKIEGILSRVVGLIEFFIIIL